VQPPPGRPPLLAPGKYPPLPFPRAYRSPSGTPGQIVLSGLARKVTLFHGEEADEADWHVYIEVAPQTARDLSAHLRALRFNVGPSDFDTVYSEVMVVDRHRNIGFPSDEEFTSADVTHAFRLAVPGSAHPAWDLGRRAYLNQGRSQDYSAFSRLVQDRGRVYLQGPFVNDVEHGTQPEIHPLESIAYAMDAAGRVVSARPGEAGWPARYVRWRVAVFGNSSFHRINHEPYMQRPRRVTWHLAPPAAYGTPAAGEQSSLVTRRESHRLWDGSNERWYVRRDVDSVTASMATDPADGRRTYRVSARIPVPDRWGGLAVYDFTLRVP
jgi:hypothetical protein